MKDKKSKNNKQKKRRSEALTGEDRQIWDRVAETVDPLQTRKRHVLDSSDTEALEAYLDQASSDARRDPEISPQPPRMTTAPAAKRPAKTPQKANAPPPLANFETRKARRIRSGAISIDARIDLHGMRQAQAHAALRSFLISAQARGNKWVLVITGKGVRIDDRSPGDIPFDDSGYQRERGVIRRNVPGWLAEPDLRKVVVSYTMAAQHHGGDGAMYVQLRSRRK